SVNVADNIGIEYININNAGTAAWVICADPSGTRLGAQLVSGLDVTLYTVLTIETSGVFCSTCPDNAFPGTSWVWFRVYQENSAGRIITATDSSANVTTSGIAPLFQTDYAFVSQQNNNVGSTGQISKIDFVEIQNYGSPVCLVAAGG